MELVYETNGRGFLGWLVELPGAYVRGRTMEEARGKLAAELEAYAGWLDLAITDRTIHRETVVESSLMIEDADSDILLPYDLAEYQGGQAFEEDCSLALTSAKKVAGIYAGCRHKDGIDPTKVRKTFYGDVYSTVRKQYEHICKVQLYYLGNIGARAEVGNELVSGRVGTLEAIRKKYSLEGNRLYHGEGEGWTPRKVQRRLIWHDRIHGRAMERMEDRLGGRV